VIIPRKRWGKGFKEVRGKRYGGVKEAHRWVQKDEEEGRIETGGKIKNYEESHKLGEHNGVGWGLRGSRARVAHQNRKGLDCNKTLKKKGGGGHRCSKKLRRKKTKEGKR